MQGISSHGVRHSVLEGHAEEFVLMLPLECFGEEARYPFYDSAFARPGRAVAKNEQRLLRLRPLRVRFRELQSFFFQPEFLQHSISHPIEHCQLFCGRRFLFLLHCFQPGSQALAVSDGGKRSRGLGFASERCRSLFPRDFRLCNSCFDFFD